LSGSGPDNAALLGEIRAMFDYMKKQFEIVNVKLDRIIQTMDRMEGKIDQIQSSLNEVLVNVRDISVQIGELESRITDKDIRTTVDMNLRLRTIGDARRPRRIQLLWSCRRRRRRKIRLRRSNGLIDVCAGAAHLHGERSQQVAAACTVAGSARLL
jgi:Uncharacterised protein family (UPF0184)